MIVTTHSCGRQTQRRYDKRRAMAGSEPKPGSAWLQYTMARALRGDVPMTNRRLRHAHLYVLASHQIPSVLLEGLSCSNGRIMLLRQAASPTCAVVFRASMRRDGRLLCGIHRNRSGWWAGANGTRTRSAARWASCACPMLGSASGGAAAVSRRRRMRQMTLVAFLQAQNCTNFVGSWRHPGSVAGLHDRRLLPPHRPRAGSRQVPCRLLRRSPGDAGPFRRRSCAHRRQRHPLREDGSDHHPHRDGHGDRTARAWFDLLHHLLRTVPCRARVPDAGPDDQRPRRVEHRDVDERRRGAEHGSRRARRARPALRSRR